MLQLTCAAMGALSALMALWLIRSEAPQPARQPQTTPGIEATGGYHASRPRFVIARKPTALAR